MGRRITLGCFYRVFIASNVRKDDDEKTKPLPVSRFTATATVIFDIGANIGKWTQVARTKYPLARIVAVEASPLIFPKLVENLRGMTNVTFFQGAICAGSEPTTRFYHCTSADVLSTTNRDWLFSSWSRFPHHNTDVQIFDVPRAGLDKLIQLHGKPWLIKVQPVFLKTALDVEGAEESVISTLADTPLPMMPSYIAFEWAAEMAESVKSSVHRLASYGFHRFNVQNGDDYHYFPSSFGDTLERVIDIVQSSQAKHDWGMVWAKHESACC